jgi:hypothetical protein
MIQPNRRSIRMKNDFHSSNGESNPGRTLRRIETIASVNHLPIHVCEALFDLIRYLKKRDAGAVFIGYPARQGLNTFGLNRTHLHADPLPAAE